MGWTARLLVQRWRRSASQLEHGVRPVQVRDGHRVPEPGTDRRPTLERRARAAREEGESGEQVGPRPVDGVVGLDRIGRTVGPEPLLHDGEDLPEDMGCRGVLPVAETQEVVAVDDVEHHLADRASAERAATGVEQGGLPEEGARGQGGHGRAGAIAVLADDGDVTGTDAVRLAGRVALGEHPVAVRDGPDVEELPRPTFDQNGTGLRYVTVRPSSG
jgi:hypothetical protein